MKKEHSFQMAFEFDIPEDQADVESGLSVADIQARRDEAKLRVFGGDYFGKDDDGYPIVPAWFEAFLRYDDGGYPFRVAVYMAWLGLPKSKRDPGTKKELADMLGLSSPRQFYVWETKYPKIREVAKGIWRRKILDGMPDAIDAMVEMASKKDYKGKYDRELMFRMARELSDSSIEVRVSDDLADLSTDELKELLSRDAQKKIVKEDGDE